ncbi:MAG: hypothetical protein ACPGU1_21505 [Myxococcota bacterium]
MKVIVPLLLLVLLAPRVAAEASNEASNEAIDDAESCEADPVKDESAKNSAQLADLAREFTTVTTETVDDALKRTDAYWDARESEVFAEVSERLKRVNEAAVDRPPAEWIEACHKTAAPFRLNCAFLKDPALREVCDAASGGDTLERCRYAKPALEPACRLIRGGGAAPCEAATGEARALCDRLQAQLARAERVCSGPEFDAAACFGARVLKAFQGGVAQCGAIAADAEPIARGLVERACRAVVNRQPDACPNPTDNHRQSAYVDVLLRSRSGVPWVVVIGGSTGSAMCAVDVALEDGDIVQREQLLLDLSREGRHVDTSATGFRGALGATRLRLGGRAHPMRATVRAVSACAPVPTWTGPGER